MKKVVLLVIVLLVSAVPAMAQTADGPQIAEEELVPWTPETGYSVIDWYEGQVAGQYNTEPLPGYVSWDEYCWYDPADAYVIGPDSNIPTVVTPCGSYN